MAQTEKKDFEVVKTDEEWRKSLTPEQYQVLRGHGTERPGSCALLREHRPGTFSCVACGQKLFVADRKFESGTGWPSFFAPHRGRDRFDGRRQPLHAPHRGALQPLRRPPGTRLRGWSAADRAPLLHQRRGIELRAAVVRLASIRLHLSHLQSGGSLVCLLDRYLLVLSAAAGRAGSDRSCGARWRAGHGGSRVGARANRSARVPAGRARRRDSEGRRPPRAPPHRSC